ncbi:hypothetical protein GCK72_011565 [Caenorhabditis remanei]|uniref:Sdz-33 F-box domain-containing protein n=1 Tax=Caenorhabditis remanei TaxID=31234 RepID=A0A6A5H8B1_CAERE|nr:hypothetical protein GCK72_011565 [Caenorhabditis remanei]KAF1763299.1 hypothetical protein GCK72_011565 [Caenorhabditis remanei]
MTDPLFPLLKLPYLGQKLVIKLMSIDEQLRYSTISQNTSLFLKNLHLKVDFITLRVTNEFISIIMNTSSHIYHHLAPASYSEKKHQKPRLFLDIPVTVFGGDESILRKPEWSLRDWREYLVKTYNCKKFKLKVLSCDFYDIESVIALFKGLNVIGVEIQDSNQENDRKILKMFPPKQELELEHPPFEGFVLMNLNLDYLKLGYYIEVTVHNLMRMKTKNIEIRTCQMRTVELNNFIKKWIRMETNLELETLSLVLNKCRIDRNQVLNRIAHLVVEPTKIFTSEYPTTLWEELESPKEQYEIRREDGKKATIQWFEPRFGYGFKLIVSQE